MSYGTHYKDIWTKDPHGGAYHRVSAAAFLLEQWRRLFARSRACAAQAGDTNEGYDALTQRPDRSIITLEPGARLSGAALALERLASDTT
jgi:hypothetical protein